MDFFDKFRRLGNQVESQTKELKEVADQVSTGDAPCDGSAAMMLIGKQTEVKSVKTEAEKLLKTLKDSQHFLTLVQSIQALSYYNRTKIDETSNHLSRYGYQRRVDSESNAGHGHEETIEDEQTVDSDTIDSATISLAVSQVHEANSTHKVSDDPFDLPPTPKLSDFGISEETMRKMGMGNSHTCIPQQSSLRNKAKTPQKVSDDPFELPPTPQPSDFGISEETMSKMGMGHSHIPQQSSLRNSSSSASDMSDGIPEGFKLARGAVVTPGMFGGSSMATPAPKGSRNAGFPGLPMCSPNLSNKNGDFPDSPVPPVLQTPGIPQIKVQKMFNDPCPEAKPVFNLAAEEDTDSPAVPVFQTPGLAQIKKTKPEADLHNSINLPCPSEPVISIENEMATPEMPQLTSNFKELFLPGGFHGRTSPAEDDYEKVTENPTSARFHTPAFKHPVFPSDVSGMGTPQMPELTGVYSFPSMAMPDPIPQYSQEEEEDKENIKPPTPPPVVEIKQIESIKIMQHVTEEEYNHQPAHLTSKVPLAYINSNIDKINEYMNASGSQTIPENAMKAQLGIRTRLFFLSLTILGRLRKDETAGDAVYIMA